MALVGPALKAKMKKSIEDGLAREFGDVSATEGYGGVSKAQWSKIASAISDIALDIVEEITTKAQVDAGISVATAGSPAAHTGATISPGKIS
jgi:uncharacterized lipoprotein YajG